MSELFSFGAWVRRRRKALDLTQAELASQVGCSVVTIRRIEADTRRPSKHLATQMAPCLEVDADERNSFVQAARGQRAVDHLAAPGPPSKLAVSSLNLRRINLPTPLTSLVGREWEVHQVRALLRRHDVRLVTLTGAGGIGKTRIGLHAVAGLLDDFADGICFVDLSPISDSTLVLSTIAKTLGRKEVVGQVLIEGLKIYLREKRLLLVLDNFEQVIAVAPEVVELLEAAPMLNVLVTSRTTIQVPGEHEFVVPPLMLPEPHARLPAEQLSRYEASALFIERARVVQADFQLTDITAPVVADICNRLEGLPLAIELAAASASVLSVQQIAARLDECVQLLTTSSHTTPPRHQTLEATLDWSYRLLSNKASAVLRRLAVFAGGWSLEAAEAVCADGDIAPQEVLALVSDLIHKSLVSMSIQNGEARYRMLEMVRQYAYKQLVDADELECTQEKHLLFFAQFIERAKPQLIAVDQMAWFERLNMDLDNLRSAINRSLAQAAADLHPDAVIRALLMPADLERFWSPRGYSAEGSKRLRRVLDLPMTHAPVVAIARAHALNAAGVVALLQGQYAEGRQLVEEALAIGEAKQDQMVILFSLRNLGTIAVLQRDTSAGVALLQQCLVLGHDVGPEGRYSCAWALAVLGSAAYLEDEDTRSRTLFEESIVLLRTMGDANFLSLALRRLGQIALRQKQYERAHALLQESLDLNNEIGSPSGIASCMAALAGIHLAQRRVTEAARLLDVAASILAETADQLTAVDQEMLESHQAQAREHLGPAANVVMVADKCTV